MKGRLLLARKKVHRTTISVEKINMAPPKSFSKQEKQTVPVNSKISFLNRQKSCNHISNKCLNCVSGKKKIS